MIGQELKILYWQDKTLWSAFSFFSLCLFCISFALGSHGQFLRQSAPALVWILALLTTFFSTPLLLKNEFQQGLLDDVLLRPAPLPFYLLSRMMGEWLLIGLPLALLSFVLSPFFSLPFSEALTLSLTLIIGFPALSTLGILGGLLTLHTKGGGILLAFLILPLTIPLWVFSLSVVEMERLGLDSYPAFCLLTGVSLLLVILSIGASSWALRFVGEEG